MAVYRLNYKPSLEKDLKPIPRAQLKRLVKVIEQLSSNPRPYGSKKLIGQNKYRIKLGDYRMLYTIDDANRVIRILKIGHRKDIYRVSEEKTKYVSKSKK